MALFVAAATIALPWNSWLDVLSLVLVVAGLSLSGSALFYLAALERTMRQDTVSEAQVIAWLAAQRRELG